MQLQKTQNRIAELMALLVTQASGAAATGKTDLSRVAESVLVPLFQEVFGYQHLRNLNTSERQNYPGVDLADDEARVAIQVTATASGSKVKETLRTFIRHQLHQRFDRLVIYIITQKQRSYAATGYQAILQNRLRFEPREDILDFRDVLKRVDGLSLDHARRVERILETHLAEPEAGAPATSEDFARVLSDYAKAVCRSRHLRLSTGGVLQEAAVAVDRIREPTLDDTYVEPLLVPAGLLRQGREEVSQLLERCHDEELDEPTRKYARERLLELQSQSWRVLSVLGAKPASEMLAHSPALVVLGDPGSGKSTLLRYLLLSACRTILSGASGPVPVLIAIADYAEALRREGHLPLATFTCRYVEAAHPGMGTVIRTALAPSGPGLLLLLDGLDEVPRETRRAAAGQIQEFLNGWVAKSTAEEIDHPSVARVQVRIASRFFGYQEAPISDPADQVVVAPFNDEQIRTFAGRWFAWVERVLHPDNPDTEAVERDTRMLVHMLSTEKPIRELARNPLLLSMIAVLARTERRLPARRVELYDIALRQLVSEWDFLRREQGDSSRIDYEDTCRLWAPVARWMHEVGAGAVHEKELRQRLREQMEVLGEPDTSHDWLTVRGDKTCLLQERGPRIFGFLHPTFEEYLAAMDIYREDGFVPELGRYIEDPRWHEVIRLACGYLGVITRGPQARTHVTSLVQQVLSHDSPYEHLLHRDLLLAASCVADQVKVRKEAERDVAERILYALAAPAARKTADLLMNALQRLPEVEVGSDRLQHLGEQILNRSSVAERLVYWLADRSDAASARLLETACRHESADVKATACALWWALNPQPEVLASVLETMDDQAGIFDLFDSGFAYMLSHEEELRRGLDHPSEKIRLRAATLVCLTREGRQTLEPFWGFLHSSDPDVSFRAASLLVELSGRELDDTTADKVVQALDLTGAERHLDDVGGLYERTGHVLLKSLLFALLRSENPKTQLNAAFQLLRSRRDEPEVAETLYGLFGNQDPHVRLRAADLLRWTAHYNDRVREVLVDLLTQDDPAIRLSAAGNLGLGGWKRESLAPLVALLVHPEPWVRRSALNTLASYGIARDLHHECLTELRPHLAGYELAELPGIAPRDCLYEAAWLYASLATEHR